MVFNTRHIFTGFVSLALPLSVVATNIDEAIKSDTQTNITRSSITPLLAAFKQGFASGALSKNTAIGILVGAVDSQNDLNKKTLLKIGGVAITSAGFQSIDAMKNSSNFVFDF